MTIGTNAYSTYSQTGMYTPSYMQTQRATTTTTTQSEEKGGIGMGTVLTAGAIITAGFIAIKNGGLKKAWNNIKKLFGSSADDAAKNLNLLEKVTALFKGTNAKKGTDAIEEALTEAASRTGKKRWFSNDIIDIAKKTDVADKADDISESLARELTDREKAIQTRIDNIKANLPDDASDALKQNLQYRENTIKNIRNIDDLTATQQEEILKNLETQLDSIEQIANIHVSKATTSTITDVAAAGKAASQAVTQTADEIISARIQRLQNLQTEAQNTIKKYGETSIEGKEAAAELLKIKKELNAATEQLTTQRNHNMLVSFHDWKSDEFFGLNNPTSQAQIQALSTQRTLQKAAEENTTQLNHEMIQYFHNQI